MTFEFWNDEIDRYTRGRLFPYRGLEPVRLVSYSRTVLGAGRIDLQLPVP